MSLTLSAGAVSPLGWLARQAAEDEARGRFVLLLPAAAVVGIFTWAGLSVDPSPWLLGAFLAALVALHVAAGRHGGAPLLGVTAMMLAAFVAGMLAIALESRLVGTAMVNRTLSADITGRIVSVERFGATRQRVVVAPMTTSLRGPVPRRVRLVVRSGPPLETGAVVGMRARLFPLRGPVMPGGYDPARRLYFDGIGATGFVYGAPWVIEAGGTGWRGRLSALRRTIADRIMASGAPSAPFAVALLVGERGLMSPDVVEALRRSGLGHILAISGLHMALFAGAVFGAVRLGFALIPRVALRYPIKKWAAVAGLAAATIYLALSGASVATIRAYVMLVIGVAAVLADRPVLTMRTVAVAAAVLIALDPVSVMEPGFQMSFLAVTALVGTYEWWGERRRTRDRPAGRRSRLLVFLIGLAVTSFVAGLATAPASAYHFHRLAPLGLLANLLAMPVFTFIAMPAGVIALFLMPLGLESLPLHVMGGALDLITVLAATVTGWSGERGLVGAIPATSTALAAAGIVILSVLTAPWRLAGAVLIGLGLLVAPLAAPPDILLAEDGRSIAARGPDGRLTLAPKTSKFAASVFLRADGDARAPRAARAADCADNICRLPLAGGALTLKGVDATTKPVATATTSAPLAEPVVLAVERAHLARHGALTARLRDGRWQVRHARPLGPVRPWHVETRPRRRRR
ncbi:MAG: ComEC/Rec2 family competence protein [Acuticoccus sp.]